MSKRRKEGDKVWLAKRGGCVGSSKTQQGTIHDNGFPCILDCGDNHCVEWDNVQAEDGTWAYHVTECDMFDTQEEATQAGKSDELS